MALATYPECCRAEYYPKMTPTEETQLGPAEWGFDPDFDLQVKAVFAEMDLYLEGCIELGRAWNKHLIPFRGKRAMASGMLVYELTGNPETPAAPAAGKTAADPVYLGLGHSFDKLNEWTSEYKLFTFKAQGGGVRLIDQVALEYKSCTGVFTVDFNHDGQLEVICQNCSGVSPAGVIEIWTLSPDGTFTPFTWPSLQSSFAKCEVLDLDANGYWELELYGASFDCAGEAYYVLSLFGWESAWSRYNDLLHQHPEHYAQYMAFYSGFAAHCEQYHLNPELYPADATGLGVPACEIDGKLYRLESLPDHKLVPLVSYAVDFHVYAFEYAEEASRKLQQ